MRPNSAQQHQGKSTVIALVWSMFSLGLWQHGNRNSAWTCRLEPPKKQSLGHFSAVWPRNDIFLLLLLFFFTALSLATPFSTIYSGLWSYNSSLSCIAIGGMFYAFTWQTHLLAITCGMYPMDLCYHHSFISKQDRIHWYWRWVEAR